MSRSISYLYSFTCAWYMFSSAAMAFICRVFSRRFCWYTLSCSATSGPGCRARMFLSST